MDVLGVPGARIHVVHNGIAPTLRPSPEEKDSTARERYRLPDRYALYLGGFDVRKNLRVVLEAWPGVWESTRTPLVVAGRRPVRENSVYVDWFSAYQGEPWLRLLGEVAETDKAAVYRAATVFVFPSRYEGFGLDPLEAMACGVPVVAAKAASLPEVLGDAALFVATDDVAGWERLISEVLSDPVRAASLRDAGLKRARMFTWQRAAEATMAVYDEVPT
jgi:glycosyltransferase involved in cell wall biosynthesis